MIMQFEIDLTTGKAISPVREIWSGASGIIPERPHMYKKGSDYFLLVAEGGTHRGGSFPGDLLRAVHRIRSLWDRRLRVLFSVQAMQIFSRMATIAGGWFCWLGANVKNPIPWVKRPFSFLLSGKTANGPDSRHLA